MENTTDVTEGPYANYVFFEDPFTKSPVKQILITVYVTIFFLGFTGNLMVIFVIARNKSMRTVTNFFLGNLAVSDFLAMTFSVIPILFTYVAESWHFGDIICRCAYFLINVTTTSSILILAVISVERYMAILHPFELRQLVTTKLLSITVSVIWVIAFFLGLPTVFSYSVIEYGDHKFCSPQGMDHNFMAIQNIARVIFLYLLPLTVMCILYGAIGRTLWASSPDVKFSQCNGEKHTKDKKKASHVAYSPASSVVTFGTTSSPPPGNSNNFKKHIVADEESSTIGKVGPFLLEEPVEHDLGPSGDSDFYRDGNDNVRIMSTNRTHSSPASKISTPVPRRGKNWSIFKPSLTSKNPGGAAGFKSLASSRNSKRRRKTEAVRAARRKAVRMLSIIALCFAFCLFPMQLAVVLVTVEEIFEVSINLLIKPWFYPFAYACYFMNSALNPFLYAFLSNNFRKNFLETITCQTNRRRRNARCVQRLKSVTSDVQTELVYVP